MTCDASFLSNFHLNQNLISFLFQFQLLFPFHFIFLEVREWERLHHSRIVCCKGRIEDKNTIKTELSYWLLNKRLALQAKGFVRFIKTRERELTKYAGMKEQMELIERNLPFQILPNKLTVETTIQHTELIKINRLMTDGTRKPMKGKKL